MVVTMSTEHIIDLLPAYALNCLDADELAQATAHLADCPTCRAELEAYEQLTADLALAAPDAAPSPALRQKLMRSLSVSSAARPAKVESWWHTVVNFMARPVPAWSLVGLAAVLMIVITYLWLWQPRAAMPSVALLGTEVAPKAHGVIIISSDGRYGALVVEDLPALTAGQQYQLWLIEDSQRTNGGIFSVNDNGYQSLTIEAPQPLQSYSAFGITIEPAGGSPGPTGPKVLGSSL
jgi:anti-sigma-K factor RskA